MPEWRIATAGRSALRSALRAQLDELVPGARLIASDLLAAESPIDLLLAGPEGEAIAVGLAEAGHEFEALARAQAHTSWIAARIRDWRKLAPELPLRPERPVRALVLVQEIGDELRAAAAGMSAVELRQIQALETPDGLRLLLLPSSPARSGDGAPPAEPLPRLRTSLSDAELGLTPEEAAAFDD